MGLDKDSKEYLLFVIEAKNGRIALGDTDIKELTADNELLSEEIAILKKTICDLRGDDAECVFEVRELRRSNRQLKDRNIGLTLQLEEGELLTIDESESMEPYDHTIQQWL